MEYVAKIISLEALSLRRFFSPIFGFGQHLADHFIPHARNNYHPHVLGHRTLALFSVMLVAIKIFTITVLTFGPILPAFSSAINIPNIINLTNESRKQFSLSALTENQLLNKAAQAKADDMLAKGYFAHNSPDGKTPWDFIVATGYSYLQAGENLAVNFSEAEDVETAWMNSPGHKANILNKNFQEIGIGVAQGIYQGHNAIFVVQEFGDPAAQKVLLTQEPTKVQTETVPVPTEIVSNQEQLPANSPVKNVETKPALAQIRGDASQSPAKPEVVALEKSLSVVNASVSLEDNRIIINADVQGEAVKVLAYFGGQAVMLNAKGNGQWQAEVLAAAISKSSTSVRINAFDINGKESSLHLADFAPNTIENYNLSGSVAQKNTTVFGITFDPKNLENRFYILFIAGLLTSLIIAISVKRHVQHLSLIANSSFVVMFASLLLWMG
jgi:hypothetical protein